MRSPLTALVAALLLSSAAGGAESTDAAPPIVEQVLAQAPALELSAAQVDALEGIRDRRTHTLETLRRRLHAAERHTSAAATHDALTLMQEIGRLQVLSGREALQQLSPEQRTRWAALPRLP